MMENFQPIRIVRLTFRLANQIFHVTQEISQSVEKQPTDSLKLSRLIIDNLN